MKLFKLTLILLLSLIMTNCSSDNSNDDEMETDEANQIIRDFIGDDCFSVLDELNFNINEGTNIPEVEGFFTISPAIALSSSNIIEEFDFDPEEELLDMTFAISDLNPDGSFIFFLNTFNETIREPLWVGNGNDFSVFFTIDLDSESFIIAISGTITQEGIQDGQFLICEGSDDEIGGVLFFDSDGLFEFNCN